MSEELMELLREFRAEVPAPSAQARQLARARVAAVTMPAERRGLARLRSRFAVAVLVGAAAAAAAVVLVLVAPWQQGPGAVTAAEAAVVLRGVSAATAPRPGWIFHERTLTTAPGTESLTKETWRQDAVPYHFRGVITASGQPNVELGGTRKPLRVFAFDSETGKLYRNPPQVHITPGRVQDEAQALRQQLAGKPVTPQGGHWKVEAKTTLDGRSVYRLALVMPPPMGYVGLTYYVDAKTYVPVEIRSAAPGGQATQVTRVDTYEYLRPTAANLKLADIRAQHPQAPVLPGAQAPPALLQLLAR